jgi:hypothetical protein
MYYVVAAERVFMGNLQRNFRTKKEMMNDECVRSFPFEVEPTGPYRRGRRLTASPHVPR